MNSEEEIISLQFGNFANYISAHYFNIQEAGFSYNPNFIPDVLPGRLFRSSKDSTGNILDYTPRTVLVDEEIYDAFKEETSDMAKTSKIVPDEPQHGECSSSSNTQQAQKIEKVFKYQRSRENIKNWSDYLNVSFHPRSFAFAPKEYGLSFSESTYYFGNSNTKQIYFWDKFEDNVRFFAEECDTLQGFQIITDGNTAYSGIASTAINYLKDEYPKKIRIVTPAYYLNENSSYKEKYVHLCNAVSFLADAIDNSDVIIPMSLHKNVWKLIGPTMNHNLRNVNFKGFDKYENSAVLAAAYEYITLPYRKRDETNISMNQFCQINATGRTISNPAILMPFTAMNTDSILNILKNWTGPFFECISPFGSNECCVPSDIMYIFSKGILKKRSFDGTRNMMVEECAEEVENYIQTFIQMFYSPKILKNYSSSTNFRIPTTFPQIFDNNFNLTNTNVAELIGRISEFNGLSCLMNSKEIKNKLELLCSKVLMNYRKLHLTADEASEIDFNSICERLISLGWNYVDHYEL